MGMFDWVECKYPIPELEGLKFEKDFQTKSFENFLECYRIDSDGQLWRRFVSYEQTPEEERPYYGTDNWPKLSFVGSIRAVKDSEKWERWPWHGSVDIYTSVTNDEERDWVDIYFLFDSGKVKSYVIKFSKNLTGV